MYDLLRIIRNNGGVSKTQLVHRGNLSFPSIDPHLERLQARQFVLIETGTDGHSSYRLTQRGEQLYHVLAELYGMID